MEDGRGRVARDVDPRTAAGVIVLYAGGLRAQEQTILHDAIRLVEHEGRHYRFADSPAGADLLLLDGASRATIELIRAGGVAARRAIVVDPPAGLSHPHVIRRPIHAIPLLKQLEQVLAEAHGLVMGTTPPPLPAMDIERLTSAALDVLRRHLGPAAEFVVEDATIAVEGAREEDRCAAFLAALEAQLPASLDSRRVVAEVSAAAKVRRV